ncbi:MAG: hypothetical protein ACREXR_12760, partial [Gammaproteobacteria bacterium]
MKDHRETAVRPCEERTENLGPRASWLSRLLERRHARQLERMRQAAYARRTRYVHKIIAERGLTQSDYSIGGGRCVHIPQVVAMDDGPPETMDILMLVGQTPDEFAAQASAIAYNLGVVEVRVVPIAHHLIRLE